MSSLAAISSSTAFGLNALSTHTLLDNEAATSDNVITRHLFKARSALSAASNNAAAAAAMATLGAASSNNLFLGGLFHDGRSSAMSTGPDASPAAASSFSGKREMKPFSVRVEGHDIDEAKGAGPIIEALRLREIYKSKPSNETRVTDIDEMAKLEITMKHGVCWLPDGVLESKPVPWDVYIKNLIKIFYVMENGPSLSFAKSRLLALEEKFQLFSLLNEDLEEAFDAHSGGGGVFGRSVKVDNAVRLATCVTADVLVENIRRAARHRATDVVHIDQHNRPMTFRELTEVELQMDASTVTAEGLGLHPPARKEPSKRYDVLDPDMNPSGEDGVELLSLFLECHGFNGGRFFAELVRPMLEIRETNALQAMSTATTPQASLNIAAEYKLSILGRRIDEWPIIARWICENNFPQMTRAIFNIEIPRVEKKRDSGIYDCRTNEDQLRNIFYPMFMATLRPADPEVREIAIALCRVGAICISSDEKIRRVNFHTDEKPPATKGWQTVPDDYYFFYYVWANLFNLNALRRKMGLNTFQFRTICAEETTHWDQLCASFLLADHVEQAGNRLGDSWVLQYLYNISRIGVIMSPISSNGAGVSFFESAFPQLFRRGLMASLGTGDPLHFHHNPEPLVEEYGICQSHFGMSTADMAEIARASVLISCFSNEFKSAALGPTWMMGVDGNTASKSHVNDVRLNFRHECLMQEQAALNFAQATGASGSADAKMLNYFRAAIHNISEPATTSSGAVDLLAALRGMQRINRVDKRVPLNRIVIDGPPPNPLTVRPMANSLRSAITLRNQYQAARSAIAIADLAVENEDAESKKNTENNNNHNNNDDDDRDDASVEEGDQQLDLTKTSSSSSSATTGAPPAANGTKRKKKNTIQTAAAAAVAAKEKMLSTFQAGDDETIERAFNNKFNDKFDSAQYSFGMYYGVCLFHVAGTSPEWPAYIPEFEAFATDVAAIRQILTEDSALAEFCQQRLQLLEHRMALHTALNINREVGEVKDRELNNRDFYTCARVDNFLASEACMNARVLYHYFTERARVAPHDVVFERNKHPVTLRQYLSEIGIDDDIDRLTVDELTNLLGRHQELRRLFLSPDNYMGGRYFAELTKHTMDQYKEDKFSFAEMRLPIYGRSRGEWDVLASWCNRYGMVSSQTRWVARISRSYRHLKREGHVENFGNFLDHIFMPLWEVSLNPAKYPKLHHFLAYVAGFDCDGNEQKVDMTLELKPPHEWNGPLNPPFNYYMYYLWANITNLNAFRRQRGLNVFSFRPQAGESGSLDHLIGAFLTADGISHGVTLMQSPTLQYLFYITQLPIVMCPLSNTNVIPYLEHPFSHFFSRGLNVSLATNKPLFNHFTSEPLIEEYSLAAKIWKLQNGDLAELARNSVRMSDFSASWKRQKLGPLWDLNSAAGNRVELSRVSDFRVAYRYETYHEELDHLDEVYALEDLRAWITNNIAAAGGAASGISTNLHSPYGSGAMLLLSAPSGSHGVLNSSFALAAAAMTSVTAATKSGRKLSTMSNTGSPGSGGGGGGSGTGGGVVGGGGSGSGTGGLQRTASRMTTKQLIAQAHSVREPFPRAMLSLEMEVEVHQSRIGGPPLFIPSAAGEKAHQQEEEEELGRAAMAARLRQQVAELTGELAARNVEIKRLTELQFSVATDIGDCRRRTAALLTVPATKIEANLNTQS